MKKTIIDGMDFVYMPEHMMYEIDGDMHILAITDHPASIAVKFGLIGKTSKVAVLGNWLFTHGVEYMIYDTSEGGMMVITESARGDIVDHLNRVKARYRHCGSYSGISVEYSVEDIKVLARR